MARVSRLARRWNWRFRLFWNPDSELSFVHFVMWLVVIAAITVVGIGIITRPS